MMSNAERPYAEAALAWLRERIRAIARRGQPVELNEPWQDWSRLASLGDAFGLTADERRVLLLAAAPELDATFPAFCEELFGQNSIPTFALAEQLFPDSITTVTAGGRPLRYYALLDIFQPGGTPLLQSEVHASEWVIGRLRGDTSLDSRLSGCSSLLPSESAPIAPSQAPAVQALRPVFELVREGRALVAQVCGPASTDKQSIVAAAGHEWQIFRLREDAVALAPGEIDLLGRLWEREARVRRLALFIDLDDLDDAPESQTAAAVRRFVNRTPVPIILAIREPWRGIDRPGPTVDVARPLAHEQETAWRSLLGPAHPELAGQLSAQFNLGISDIERIGQEAGTLEPEIGPSEIRERLWSACKSARRPQMEGLAERVPVSATLDDVVLPDAEKRLLCQLIAQVQNRSRVYNDWGVAEKSTRGLGITAVFAGESGTGKTLAAEALASALALDLYRIDLSAVVNKYIGETEKSLRRLFDAAEDGGVILFFDEADALFGKRTEVKESHDRFANIEINYLLQRIETYRGLVILATNMKSALDQAFLRRMRFVANFPFPDVEQRLAIWEKVLPEARRAADLDLRRLARLNVTGGNIRNIAINALFLAADDGADRVTYAHARRAAEDEYRKIGRAWDHDRLDRPAGGKERVA